MHLLIFPFSRTILDMPWFLAHRLYLGCGVLTLSYRCVQILIYMFFLPVVLSALSLRQMYGNVYMANVYVRHYTGV